MATTSLSHRTQIFVGSPSEIRILLYITGLFVPATLRDSYLRK